MSDTMIKGVYDQSGLIGDNASTKAAKTTDDKFTGILKDAIKKVDNLQKEADGAIQEFTLGKAPLHKTMIAIEKANLSFQLMLQVRNKIVDAYQEIMKTQV